MIAQETDQLKQVVRTFINKSINIDGLDDDENLFESGIVNSLFAIQLTTFIERNFAIEIGVDDLEIENFKSISATAAFIERRSARLS